MASSSLLALPGASSLAYTTLPTTRTPSEPRKPNSSFCLKARCSSSLAQPPAEAKSTSAPAATILSCSRRELLGAAMAALGGAVVASPPQAEAAPSSQATCGTYNVSPSGLAFCDSLLGQGVAASKGLLIKAHYSGRLENGVEFDSSYKRGKPLTFRVGVGEVIRGWDQGILGTEGIPAMQAGGKRTLKIPAKLGYGERGAGCRLGSCLIPPNSTLIFDVEFVGKA